MKISGPVTMSLGAAESGECSFCANRIFAEREERVLWGTIPSSRYFLFGRLMKNFLRKLKKRKYNYKTFTSF